MKKIKLSVAALLLAGGSLFFSNCIGSFALTNSVLKWNNNVGKKFVNELVFVAFWILPVYEVTAVADLLILNSIEFWRGENPVEASTQIIDTEQGTYLIVCDETGYLIRHESTGRETRLNFNSESKTWSVQTDNEEYPFMTLLDDNHVKMITPDGDFRIVELSQNGLQAYSEMVPTLTEDYI